MNEREQAKAVLGQIMQAIVETVNEAPMGAPCGPLYMALMHVWPSMNSLQFNTLIAALVDAGKVERRNHCLFKPAYDVQKAWRMQRNKHVDPAG